MHVQLNKKPKKVTIIDGFPGFGLVGTITTEFLIEHLKCEKIGTFYFQELPATIAIHEQKLVDPVGIFYNKEYNLVIIHSISGATGVEWKAAEMVIDITKQLQAKELISIDGVGSMQEKSNRTFYYTNEPKKEAKLKTIGISPLKEGIIMGVTSALLIKSTTPLLCIFAETQSNMPDSKAAAKVIEVLDKYLGLKVDYAPLIETSQKFEEKLKKIMEQSEIAKTEKDKKELSYVG